MHNQCMSPEMAKVLALGPEPHIRGLAQYRVQEVLCPINQFGLSHSMELQKRQSSHIGVARPYISYIRCQAPLAMEWRALDTYVIALPVLEIPEMLSLHPGMAARRGPASGRHLVREVLVLGEVEEELPALLALVVQPLVPRRRGV